ncbi:putative Oleandomycin polyketide synthase, modules 5 and 6 [Streptomyces aurantiacus JA 4570]|uniref:Putative Oleandomycin polyketide synthase, modules 5 and 6 n=1 Tax=Streptomyces aurantiacus JA 4570 TaxID=1286094 RepID=S3Z718_9ACTN|nr:putative Oleandomycin polyketide synthase, modules 5 and 6 [Streptomyces aurantiacus JA 4570]
MKTPVWWPRTEVGAIPARSNASQLERLPGGFQEEALLGVDGQGLAR